MRCGNCIVQSISCYTIENESCASPPLRRGLSFALHRLGGTSLGPALRSPTSLVGRRDMTWLAIESSHRGRCDPGTPAGEASSSRHNHEAPPSQGATMGLHRLLRASEVAEGQRVCKEVEGRTVSLLRARGRCTTVTGVSDDRNRRVRCISSQPTRLLQVVLHRLPVLPPGRAAGAAGRHRGRGGQDRHHMPQASPQAVPGDGPEARHRLAGLRDGPVRGRDGPGRSMPGCSTRAPWLWTLNISPR